ncbi:MAG: hypothetical protein Q8N68_02780, partial [bacterium]|nr:hypothetical protein [bacterium]
MSIAKNRRLNRLKGYNYSQDGWYFVTLCVKNCENFLGNIANGKIRLSEIGEIAQKYWLEIPQHFPNARLDEFIVMPNHLHGIIGIENNIAGNKNAGNENVGNNNHCSLLSWQKQWALSLSSIIRGFKIGVTKWRRQNNDQ